MITQDQRDELKKLSIRGDIQRAVVIYNKNTGREIGIRAMQKFVTGERKNTGINRRAHQPLELYRAMAQAIAERLEKEKRMQNMLADIRRFTIEAAVQATS